MNLKIVAAAIAQDFTRRARRMRLANMFMKLVLIALTAVAAAMQFFTTNPWTHVNYWGVAACIGIALCGIFFLFFEVDAVRELEHSRKAIELARKTSEEVELTLSAFSIYEEAQNRAVALYRAMEAMREALEQALDLRLDLQHTVNAMMHAGKGRLRIACGFQLNHHYTICVYEARTSPENGLKVLHCISQDRAVECEIRNARTWPAGVGVSGYALSAERETVVPDMDSDTRSWPNALTKPNDAELFRSIAAIPVYVGRKKTTWGVVTETSDRLGHFDNDEEGVKSLEGLRALAGMVGLAVQAQGNRDSVKI